MAFAVRTVQSVRVSTMVRFPQLVMVLLACPGLASIAAGQEFYLAPADHVLFRAESNPGERLYESVIETFVITRYPQRRVLFTHSHGYEGPEVAALSSPPTVIVVAPQEDDLMQRM